MRALDQIVRQGKALYIGFSNYSGVQLAEAMQLARQLNLTQLVATQARYNLMRREAEQTVFGRGPRQRRWRGRLFGARPRPA